MDLSTITVNDFKKQFPRDFDYQIINSDDIENAFDEAGITFNQSLFGTDAQVKIGFLYLSAHYLTVVIRNAKGGITGQGSNPVSARSVGSVSESYAIPEWMTSNPFYGLFSQTGYGQKYLMLALGKTVGNVQSIGGATQP